MPWSLGRALSVLSSRRDDVAKVDCNGFGFFVLKQMDCDASGEEIPNWDPEVLPSVYPSSLQEGQGLVFYNRRVVGEIQVLGPFQSLSCVAGDPQ
ncbi:hypothetical protein HGM15179_014469 [Zosterops borbonicus]|uniref:Uncharacterized protein n=1 Tax=Zosterops borbonicus TaxID=364589 RepID=A0A8K1G658_9PASS|nr:hypothetical protein HGM15179_014469 [Zosterops borbonicus]